MRRAGVCVVCNKNHGNYFKKTGVEVYAKFEEGLFYQVSDILSTTADRIQVEFGDLTTNGAMFTDVRVITPTQDDATTKDLILCVRTDSKKKILTKFMGLINQNTIETELNSVTHICDRDDPIKKVKYVTCQKSKLV